MTRLTTRQKMALARGLQHPIVLGRRIFGRGPETTVSRRGLRWQLDLREGIDFAIWLEGYFEPATVAAYESIVEPGAMVVDIGANIGAHTLPLARAVGRAGCVVACEPTAETFARLLANLAANPTLAARVRPRQAMLLAEVDAPLPETVIASWPLAPTEGVHPVIRGRHLSTRGAGVTCLDALVADEGLDRVDLIKLDVDGYECDVLDGAAETLARFRPPIITEIAPFALEASGRELGDLTRRFDAAGYRLDAMGTNRPLSRVSLDRLRKRRVSQNVVARPATG